MASAEYLQEKFLWVRKGQPRVPRNPRIDLEPSELQE